MMQPQKFTPEQAAQKARHYCAYQERCHSEVREKLYGWGLKGREVEKLIAGLVEESYLNEERFSILFAGGKFRAKEWGRVKIKYELKKRGISAYCIQRALKEIDETDYLRVLQKLTDNKSTALKNERNIVLKKKKVQQYLLTKGFEQSLVNECIRTIEIS